MAFDRDALYISSAGFGEVHNKLWTYDSSDEIPAITADGYFPTDLLFSRGDFIAVVPGSGSSAWIVVDSISPFIRTSELPSGPNPADSITTNMLQDSCVTIDKLAPNSVGSGKIKAGAVLTADLADGAVTDEKIAAGIDGSKISTNTVPGTSIVDGSITANQLGSLTGWVTSNRIQNGAVKTADLSDGAVTQPKLDTSIITLKYAEEFTTTAAATNQSFTVADATATDKVWAAMSLGTSGMFIEQVTAAAGSVTVTWGGVAPSATDKVVIFGVS